MRFECARGEREGGGAEEGTADCQIVGRSARCRKSRDVVVLRLEGRSLRATAAGKAIVSPPFDILFRIIPSHRSPLPFALKVSSADLASLLFSFLPFFPPS